ncbi:hypothetical protein CANARDRAFT_26342 [[Candida] arabinofermentans NRRL YB-2248]|uniref:CSC1/OSCA1-like 7TM region domain-containing protein n=1 Tax=[Candida] arabinofermentans NRRL YB-2248 TaxID=983967 RepID=A0A1E4T8Z5_9ASCO|nr:hypothetical protein CANARDRAFT_26342 [[Candida] arabinofermentans NRRL YB-2248]
MDGLLGGNNKTEEPPPFDPRGTTQTVFKVQLYVCSFMGVLIFLIFCLTRYKFPLVYSVRPYRNKTIKRLPDNFLGWMKVLYSITNDEFLQVAGLDAYVFLCFFRMGIKIFCTMTIIGITVLTPLRYVLTGDLDNDELAQSSLLMFLSSKGTDKQHPDSDTTAYLLVCTVFTYIFTAIVYFFLFRETTHIIKTRQKCLGSQRSITDRTIAISNIPQDLEDEEALKTHIETLGVGKVENIALVHDYSELNKLFNERKIVVRKLEQLYSSFYGLDIRILSKKSTASTTLKVYRSLDGPQPGDIVYSPNLEEFEGLPDESTPLLKAFDSKNRPKKRPTHRLTMFGPRVDSFDYFSKKLIILDKQINALKAKNDFKSIPHAFVTMTSMSDAQMAAQAVFSPNVFQLITCLAPSPFDVNWENLLLSAKAVFIRKNVLELIIILFSILLIMPLRYISSLLNVNAIKKMWPEFGEYLMKHELIRTIVTGLIPTYLFTIINVILPYVISILSNLQGLVSKGDVELSVIRKNFLYIFFNMFLVFTLFGTLSSYKALLTDTTKIAPLLATSMKTLSLFYVDLILLQGLIMFPFKLLQIGDLAFLFWQYVMCSSWQTPRDYRDLFYKPALFEVGLILPQHIMIFIITIIYSVMSTKILTSGLVYFVLGYYVYKYQLVYSMVHPYHSTGKAWPIVFRRVCLGVFFLQLQMFGTLALEQSFILAGFIVPLFPCTVLILMFFNRNYQPLLHYIALDAIKTSGQSVERDGDDLENMLNNSNITISHNNERLVGTSPSRRHSMALRSPSPSPPESISNQGDATSSQLSQPSLKKRKSTIDEERESSQSYVYPHLLDPLDGPWIGFVGDNIDSVYFYAASELEMETVDSVSQLDDVEISSVIVRKRNTTIEFD